MTVPTRALASYGASYTIVDLAALDLAKLPVVHRILIENLLRRSGDDPATIALVEQWITQGTSDAEIAFWPGRVMMHDTTCGPALVDIAAARQARLSGPTPGHPAPGSAMSP